MRLQTREYSFKTYAQRFVLKGKQLAESGERNANYIRTSRLFLDNDDWGLVRHFGQRDVQGTHDTRLAAVHGEPAAQAV